MYCTYGFPEELGPSLQLSNFHILGLNIVPLGGVKLLTVFFLLKPKKNKEGVEITGKLILLP